MEGVIKGIEHTAIAAADIAALAEWYVKTLGFVINYSSRQRDLRQGAGWHDDRDHPLPRAIARRRA